jgi:outer membrane lipoprotein-sorting protein
MRKLIALTAIALLTMAADQPAEESRAETLARVEGYLTGLTTIVADFEQTDMAGEVSGGKFYLKRPGKMRWEYKPPTPVLIVSNGKVITYYDSELDQVNFIAIDDTLAGFLTRPQIKLDSDTTKLTTFNTDAAMISVTVVQKARPDEGSLTLEFSDKPLQLRKLTMVDASANRTDIMLQNAEYGRPLPDSIFKFDDPRGIAPRRQKRGK